MSVPSNFSVQASVSLGGFTSVADFSGAHATSFIRVMATLYLREPPSSVSVNTSGVVFSAASGRRHRSILATSTLAVPFSVLAANGSHATSLTAGVSALDPVAFANDFNADLVSSGVSGPQVSVVGSFAVTSVVLPPSPPVNLTAVGSNASAAVSLINAQLANTSSSVLAGLQTSILAGLDSSITAVGSNNCPQFSRLGEAAAGGGLIAGRL